MSIADEMRKAADGFDRADCELIGAQVRHWAAEAERLDAERDALRQRVEELTDIIRSVCGYQRKVFIGYAHVKYEAAYTWDGDMHRAIKSVLAAAPTPPDDTPSETGPAVGDVVLGRGRSGWVRRTDGRKVYVEVGSGQWEGWQLDECTIIARRVDSLAAAMRLLKGGA